MPPLVSIVGKSETGKTTLVQKLIQELRARGFRVAAIKHVPENLAFDEPEKDSWRHIQAGSQATAISSTERLVIIKPISQALNLDQIAHEIGEDYDIVLAEGFSWEPFPRIEVLSPQKSAPEREKREDGEIVGVIRGSENNGLLSFSEQEVTLLVDALTAGIR